MAEVIMLCGKIASGKTTYANRLHKECGAVILSCDDLMLTLFDHCLGDKHDDTVARCSRYLNSLAEQIVRGGLDAVLDFGYWRKTERTAGKAYFTSRGISVSLHYLECEEETRIKRLEERNKALATAPGRVYLIDEELRKRLDFKFEPPSSEEIDQHIRT